MHLIFFSFLFFKLSPSSNGEVPCSRRAPSPGTAGTARGDIWNWLTFPYELQHRPGPLPGILCILNPSLRSTHPSPLVSGLPNHKTSEGRRLTGIRTQISQAHCRSARVAPPGLTGGSMDTSCPGRRGLGRGAQHRHFCGTRGTWFSGQKGSCPPLAAG